MTTSSPNGAASQQLDFGNIAQRASQIAASAVGSISMQAAMEAEMAAMSRQRVAELDDQVREQQVALARANQTIRGLEQRVSELTAEMDARDADVETTDGEPEASGEGESGETGTTPEGPPPGAD